MSGQAMRVVATCVKAIPKAVPSKEIPPNIRLQPANPDNFASGISITIVGFSSVIFFPSIVVTFQEPFNRSTIRFSRVITDFPFSSQNLIDSSLVSARL